MFQTSYTGIKPLQRNSTYVGGFCRFWYIPVEDVVTFPRINSANQQLIAEPSLKDGKKWFGPIAVPRNKLGYTEVLKRTSAGHYYELKLEGIHIGDSPVSRVNLENMPYHRYLVIGKIRAGGYYHLIGSNDSPCLFNPEFKGGLGPGETAQTNFQFATEHISKAYILPSFSEDDAENPGGGGGGGGSNTMNQKEIIPFENQPSVSIPWTPTRLGKFGVFPEIEVYLQEPGEQPKKMVGGDIVADQPPPAFTELTINIGGNPTGFIVLS